MKLESLMPNQMQRFQKCIGKAKRRYMELTMNFIW